jgi:hypothetical protein
MNFLASVRARARDRLRKLVFPEGHDARTLEAVARVAAGNLAIPLVIGSDLTRADPDDLGVVPPVLARIRGKPGGAGRSPGVWT